MKIAMFPPPGGSAYWRMYDPAKYLNRLGHEARVIRTGITDEVATWADIYVLKGTVDREGIALLYAHQQEFGKKIVVDLDDALDVADDNPYKVAHDLTNAPEVVRRTMEIADLVTVTNRHLEIASRKYTDHTAILPNAMDLERWMRPYQPNTSDTIRIGWAGSITHYDDLQILVEPLKRLCAKYPQVRIITVGDPRLADIFKGCPIEAQLGVGFDIWPEKLASLRLDIGMAPLRDTPFNRAKSNIKFQEYAINRIPGVYSPTVYNFRGFDGAFGMIAENANQWERALENLILSPILRNDIASQAHSLALAKHDLRHEIAKWERAYKSLLLS